MRNRLMKTAALIAVLLLLTGCDPMQMNFGLPPKPAASPGARPARPTERIDLPPTYARPPESARPAEQTTSTDLDKEQAKPDYFSKGTVQGEGPVKEAISWMQRYTTMMEKYHAVEEQRRGLAEKLRTTETENTKLKMELAQTTKERDEADQMLQRLGADLKAWKTNVLGYRQEMMTELSTMRKRQDKILQVLLGDVPGAAQAAATGGTK